MAAAAGGVTMDKEYKRKKYLAEKYDVSVRTVDRKMDWIRSHADRYPRGAIVYAGKIPYIREDVFKDAMFNGGKVDAGIAPAFREAR
jgi:hypothetical protein